MKAWMHVADSYFDRNYKNVIEKLFDKGIEFQRPDFEQPGSFGLIFFKQINSNLLRLIKKISDFGRVRILAVTPDGPYTQNPEIWKLIHSGVSDIIPWSSLSEVVNTITKKFERWQVVDELLESPVVKEKLIGRNALWLSVLSQVIEVARFTSSNILLLGESGTGKELIARLIHRIDPLRSEGQFTLLDCSTILSELSGSEFFGHERGAFTGAYSMRDGAFALANGGCLFLDEVGELSLPLQAQLLRVVEDGTFKRVGGNSWFQTDFRLICATNRDLVKAVVKGQFRQDLYHRIANWVFTLPPLSSRANDILMLARYFTSAVNGDSTPPVISQPVQDFLLKRKYPGNVRDLQQLVTRIMDLHVGVGPITPGEIPKDELSIDGASAEEWCNIQFECAIERALLSGVKLKEIGRAAEQIAVGIAIRREDGNLQRAAELLGVTPRAIQMRRAAERHQYRQIEAEGQSTM